MLIDTGGGRFYNTDTGQYTNSSGSISAGTSDAFGDAQKQASMGGFNYTPESGLGDQWNPQQFASNETANLLAQRLGGNVSRTTVLGDLGRSQNNVNFPGQTDGYNAGLIAQTLQNNSPQVAQDILRSQGIPIPNSPLFPGSSPAASGTGLGGNQGGVQPQTYTGSRFNDMPKGSQTSPSGGASAIPLALQYSGAYTPGSVGAPGTNNGAGGGTSAGTGGNLYQYNYDTNSFPQYNGGQLTYSGTPRTFQQGKAFQPGTSTINPSALKSGLNAVLNTGMNTRLSQNNATQPTQFNNPGYTANSNAGNSFNTTAPNFTGASPGQSPQATQLPTGNMSGLAQMLQAIQQIRQQQQLQRSQFVPPQQIGQANQRMF
jgi:hypothetical protein